MSITASPPEDNVQSAALFKDPRDYQIAFLAGFLALGIGARDWTLKPGLIAIVLVSTLATQVVCGWMTGKFPSLRSAWITALSLALLLRGNHAATFILAGASAIAGKVIFKVRGKHLFNPSNFGIIAALLFTRDAWVSPGQWGEEWWYALLFAATGGLMVGRVGRWDTTGSFLGCTVLLEAFRNGLLGWTWDVVLHRLMSGSLLVFSWFMITDPRTIPDHKPARIGWAMSVAVFAFYLRNYFFLSTAIFWALFVLSPFTFLLDRWFPSKRFSWDSAGKGKGESS